MTIQFPKWVKGPTKCKKESYSVVEYSPHGAVRLIRQVVRDAVCGCGCGHERKQHSRNGCTWAECDCTIRYMDW